MNHSNPSFVIWQSQFAFGKPLFVLPIFLLSFLSVTVGSLFGGIRDTAAQHAVIEQSQSGQWADASFPIENFQGYTSPFGYRQSPTTGESEFHSGLDFAAPVGSYIRNWWAGTVVELSDHTACGTKVVIQSGQWQHTYCHLKGHVKQTSQGLVMLDRGGAIRLRKGQQVATGARIGRVGMTGRTVGPHLHWQLKHGGELIDPALVLEKMHEQQTALQSK